MTQKVPMGSLHAILAQVDLSTVEGQLSYLVERAATVEGVVLVALAMVAAVAVLPRQRGFDLAATALLFVMSFPLHYATLMTQQNTLVGPLQTLRSISRPVSYALLALVMVRSFLIPNEGRARPTSPTAIAFYCFQMYYVLQIIAFESPAKGVLAVFSVTAMMLVFASGFGREMQDQDSARRSLEVLVWLAAAFIGVNAVQIVLGFGSSFLGGRLLGTAGNAQFMGSMCCFLLLGCSYLFTDLPAGRPLRWVSLGCIITLSAFLVASGSRGNVLAAAVGLIVMFRTDLGRLLGLAIVGAMAIAIAGLLFGEEATGAQRIVSGTDTRTAVWQAAFAVFQEYPLFGSYSQLGADQPSFGVESSFVRALALLGMVGGGLFLVAAAMMSADAVRSMRLARIRPDLRRLCNFHTGLTATLLLLNVYEGVAFGVLTFPVMCMYLSFALGGLLRDERVLASQDPVERSDESDWATT